MLKELPKQQARTDLRVRSSADCTILFANVIGAVGHDKAGVVKPHPALTAFGLGQTMSGLRVTRSTVPHLVPSRLVEVGEPFFASSTLTPSATANDIAPVDCGEGRRKRR